MTGSRAVLARRPWWRRALRLLALTLAWSFLALTFASLGYNKLSASPHTLAPPGGRDVLVGSRRVHYEKWGSGATPVVLVGGFMESSVSWSLVAPRLARHHTVYALDLAGYGYTDYDGRYTLADQTELVDGFVHALGIERPLLVGHSLGAAVVGSVALAHPGDIRGVIFADGDALAFRGRDGSGSVMGAILRSPYAVSLYRIGTRWHWFGEQVIRTQCGSRCRGYSPALVQAWIRPLRQGAAESAMPRIAQAGVLHLSAAQVRAITVPRAILWGAEDADGGGSLDDTRRNLRHPHEVVLPGVGHLSMIADPEKFAAAVSALDVQMRPGHRPPA